MTLVGSNINSPTNAIYMTTAENTAFGSFKFYLDKDVVSLFSWGFIDEVWTDDF